MAAETWFQKGITFIGKGEYAEAEYCFRQVRALAPESIETLLNLGYSLDLQGRTDEAFDCYQAVLAASPSNAKARYNQASHLLRKGDLAAGFADYETRFAAMPGADERSYAQPRWHGQLLAGKTILVYAEQGFGDALMFGRYIPLLAQQGGEITLEVQQPLMRLLSKIPGVSKVVKKTPTPPLTDFHIPLLSLPHIFGTTIESIPNTVPYIEPPEELTILWRERIGQKEGYQIGLVWAGKERPYPNRSCPPVHLAPLFGVPELQLFSLQAGEADRLPLPPELAAQIIDLTGKIEDFADTAALIGNLDLVITIDTAVAHLAGAMGKPVWVMLPYSSDWRWLEERPDSPWYPTMRLFRQPQPGDWDAVVNEIACTLREWLSHQVGSTDCCDEFEHRFQAALKNIAEAPETAIAQFADLLAHLPDAPAIWFNLGRAYDSAGQPSEAMSFYRQALLLSPNNPSILLRIGELLLKRKSFAEAEVYLQKAHELSPLSIEILLVLGAALVQQDKTAMAFGCCQKMLAIDPESVEATYNLSYLQLRSGDYKAGFANFEARLGMKTLKIDERIYPQPRWDGSPLQGRSILVFGEQGLGDVIQFSRYLSLVAERGGKIMLELDPPLIPLFRSFPGVSQVLAKSDTPPVTDVYIQLLSLPYIFGTTLENIPNSTPYIIPDAVKTEQWRQLLADEATCRVGLVWRGNARNPLDQERSCPLAMLSPLAALPGVQLFSLQVGSGSDEASSLAADMTLIDHTGRLTDLSETAAFIDNLDLVIGVDTAVSHLAGAMGKPVWIMLSAAADWRWIPGRTDSPWYPTVRLFRQERRGAWAPVISQVKEALEQVLAQRQSQAGSDDIESMYNLGCLLKEDGDLEGAECYFRRITELDPDLPDPQHSLGVVLQMQGRPSEAVAHYRAAVAQDPCFVQALYNLANALVQSGKPQEAMEFARAVIECDATHADAHWLLGMLLLLHGDYPEGWAEYEWRWQARAFLAKIPDLGRPLWDGSPLAGKTLLIQMEQGRGDMIQFVRFAPLAAARGGRIIVRAVPELVSLLATAEGVSDVVDQNGPLPAFDLYIPAMSLPRVLGTTLETLPTAPYLRPDPRKVALWRRELPVDGRFRIGLAWQGSPENRDNPNRSCALAAFQPLVELEGVTLYSLQVGEGSEQVANLPDEMKVVDLTAHIHDFADTAAFIENLDLVISVCTSVTHLAGAIGTPVWTLLFFAADWRWLQERSDSPWYPSMRLFRQEEPYNWTGVIAHVRQELAQMLASAEFHNQHGIAMMQKENYARAELSFSRAAVLDQEYAEALSNRGAALHALDRFEEALDCYHAALRHQPDFLQALFNMGNIYRSCGKLDHARACYKRSLELKPDFVPAHLCLGEIAKETRDFALARHHYEQALSIDESSIHAIQGLAETCQAEEKFEEAIGLYHMVLGRQPDWAAGWNLLGVVLHSMERLDEAESCYRRALSLLPDQSVVLNNLGVVLITMGRLDGAAGVLQYLSEIHPDYAEGHWNLASALLAAGRYHDGWQQFEWRFKKSNPVPDRGFEQPRWDGSPLNGKTILLHAEQGFGDTIQFARYVPLVARLGGKIVIECQVPALKRLLLLMATDAEVIVAGESLPSFDCHLPMMSLPLVFDTTIETIPSHVPYLTAEPADIEKWRHRLGQSGKFRVGLVWFAKQNQVLNRKRSCPLQMFAPLWDVPGVEFHTLQIGLGAEQIDNFRSDHPITDLTAHIQDFADTAAYMANLDLVITIDTVAAHLAGALGIQTWVVLPHVAEWRWLQDRNDSPWYPGMRLFRQPSRGDWPALMHSVAEALSDRVLNQSNDGTVLNANVYQVGVTHQAAPLRRAGLRVGLAWSGRLDNPLNRKRSCPFSALLPMFGAPNTIFVSLQLEAPEGGEARLVDLTGQIRDFEDTAALMASLDLIISIDTSVAHLAAASGRPTWVLLSHVADWRWSIDRSDCPWYPSVRLFRQPEHGDWDSVVREVTYRLTEFSGNKTDLHANSMAAPTTPGGVARERLLLEQQLENHLEVLRMDVSIPDAQLDVGCSLALLGRHTEAVAAFRRVLALSPEHVAGHLNLAYSLLALGEYREGWEHFEWRLRRIPAGQIPPWPIIRPGQLGAHPKGTSILVHCEQGYGDTIQFSRFLPLLAEAGYRVVVSCQLPLASLVASIRGVNQVILHGEMLPACDLQVLMLSLAGLFATKLENVPSETPYLAPSQQLIETWNKKLDSILRSRPKKY